MSSSSSPPPPSSSSAPPHKPNDLPRVHRYITEHDAEGRAVVSTALAAEVPRRTIYNGAEFRLGYATTERPPVSLARNRDVAAYAGLLAAPRPPGLVVPGGTVVRVVDSPPGSVSPMHRTVSLDYGVVLEGAVELLLDSGERRLLRRGDLCVQRATMHAWRNASDVEWARMLYVLQECEPVTVAGRTLGEDYGDMAGHLPESGN
ncbi:hypothetical protein F4780DRAFT_277633 [Xylariomycetidae sp. FL0641]|nr:hypothetical protein F4780DRAFT_277633 [Xylariomycetidae sp. FL0641]